MYLVLTLVINITNPSTEADTLAVNATYLCYVTGEGRNYYIKKMEITTRSFVSRWSQLESRLEGRVPLRRLVCGRRELGTAFFVGEESQASLLLSHEFQLMRNGGDLGRRIREPEPEA